MIIYKWTQLNFGVDLSYLRIQIVIRAIRTILLRRVVSNESPFLLNKLDFKYFENERSNKRQFRELQKSISF